MLINVEDPKDLESVRTLIDAACLFLAEAEKALRAVEQPERPVLELVRPSRAWEATVDQMAGVLAVRGFGSAKHREHIEELDTQ